MNPLGGIVLFHITVFAFLLTADVYRLRSTSS